MASHDLQKATFTAAWSDSGDGCDRSRCRGRPLRLASAVALLVFLAFVSLWPQGSIAILAQHWTAASTALPHQAQSSASPAAALDCFQVAQPVLTPHGASYQSAASNALITETTVSGSGSRDYYSVLLMEHVFGFSYGKPFISNYTPPSYEFNRVTITFTVVSQGRQFDRLALMYLNDTEVWRTSTAEPTRPPGISWTFTKDVTEYLSLWKTPQTLIFDLGNLVNDKYTGSFNTTLTATFFNYTAETGTIPPADLIIPISARRGTSKAASAFKLPTDNATNSLRFPRNANRAVFAVSACGQASEEFWWSNVLQADVDAFNQTAGRMPGLSPFREIQVLIDGQVAGVDWPFPVVFTGGVSPGLHRPIVGLQAFDLREHEIDVTPWLPVLCDGAEHSFTIVVAGLDDDGKAGTALTTHVNDNWVVTGKIFVWLDDEGSITTGTRPSVELTGLRIALSRSVTQNATGYNETLAFNTTVDRALTVSATVNSQHKSGTAVWSQTLSYSNDAVVSAFGFNQINRFMIDGLDQAAAPDIYYKSTYRYPLFCNSSFSVDPLQGNLTLGAHLVQGFGLEVMGNSVFPTGLEAFTDTGETGSQKFVGSSLDTWRDGTAWFFQTGDGKNSSGHGATNQVFRFAGFRGTSSPLEQLYFRNVTAANDSVVSDTETIAGITRTWLAQSAGQQDYSASGQALFAEAPGTDSGPRAFIGRGSNVAMEANAVTLDGPPASARQDL